jgi:hypothetical protein
MAELPANTEKPVGSAGRQDFFAAIWQKDINSCTPLNLQYHFAESRSSLIFSVMPIASAIHGLSALWIGSQGCNVEGTRKSLTLVKKTQSKNTHLRGIILSTVQFLGKL